MRTERSPAHGAAMMHNTFNCAESVSFPGSCRVWLFSGVPNKITQLPSFFFLDLKRTIGQSMEEKQIKRSQHLQGKVTRGRIFLGTFGPNSEFQQGLICDCELFGSPRLSFHRSQESPTSPQLHQCSQRQGPMNTDPVYSTCLKPIQVVIQMHVW